MPKKKDSPEQKWPDHLVIVRHGESERNVAKERARLAAQGVYGMGLRDVDTPLTALGHEQAIKTGRFLAGRFKFDAVFSSPYLRTRQTTDDILKALQPKPRLIVEERLREIEFGSMDGLTPAGFEQRFPEEFERRKREGKYWYRPPGGESRPDVALRVHSFLGTLTRDYSRQSVLVVCHSVVVLIFRRLLERWGEEEYMKTDAEADVLNCAMTAYRFNRKSRRFELDHYNQVCF